MNNKRAKKLRGLAKLAIGLAPLPEMESQLEKFRTGMKQMNLPDGGKAVIDTFSVRYVVKEEIIEGKLTRTPQTERGLYQTLKKNKAMADRLEEVFKHIIASV